MTDAFLWNMVRINGLDADVVSILLWDRTVIVVVGTNGDYAIQVEAADSPKVAYALAIIETKNVETQGYRLSRIYGCRDLDGEFASWVVAAHQLHRLGHQSQALEIVVKDVLAHLYRDGECLHA